MRSKLARVYQDENDRVYQDATLEQMPGYAKIVKFVTTDREIYQLSSNSKAKIKESFNHSLKRVLNKKSLKALSFDDNFALLEALPNSTGSFEDHPLMRKDS